MLEKVQFHQDEMVCLKTESTAYVSVNSVCKSIGLNVKSAIRNLNTDQVLSEFVITESINVNGDQARTMCFLPLDFLNGWLFTIQVERVKEEARPALISYQRECYRVLYDHFHGKSAIIEGDIKKRFELTQYKKKLNRLINRLMNRHKEIDRQINAIDQNNFSQLGLFDNSKQLTA